MQQQSSYHRLEEVFLQLYQAAHLNTKPYNIKHDAMQQWPALFGLQDRTRVNEAALLHCLKRNPGNGFLWSIQEEEATIILYEDSMGALKTLFESHGLSRESATTTRRALALSHYHMWTALLNLEGGWLVKNRHTNLDGLTGEILFKTAALAMQRSGLDMQSLSLLAQWQNKSSVIDIAPYELTQAIISGFIQRIYNPSLAL